MVGTTRYYNVWNSNVEYLKVGSDVERNIESKYLMVGMAFNY